MTKAKAKAPKEVLATLTDDQRSGLMEALTEWMGIEIQDFAKEYGLPLPPPAVKVVVEFTVTAEPKDVNRAAFGYGDQLKEAAETRIQKKVAAALKSVGYEVNPDFIELEVL